MTPQEAIRFVRRHGVVLESSKGLEPSLAAEIAGEAIAGSWWGHPKGHEIYEVTERVRDSKVVLVCTLAKGRITYIHRDLWAAFVKLAERFPPGRLDRVHEVHTVGGRHKREDVPFPDWVAPATFAAARSLSSGEAKEKIHVWLQRYGAA